MAVGDFMFFASSNLICARVHRCVRPGVVLCLGRMSKKLLLVGRSQAGTSGNGEGGQKIV